MTNNQKLEALMQQPEEVIKGHTRMLKLEGIFFIILGISAIALPLLCAITIEFLLGTLFILAGLMGLLRSFKSKGIPGTIFSVLTYILFLLSGIMILTTPMLGIKIIAVILAFFFIGSGFFKMMFSFLLKPGKGWAWTLFDGIISIILGIIIFQNWPFSAIWIVGLMAGIRLILLGNAMLMIAKGLKITLENKY